MLRGLSFFLVLLLFVSSVKANGTEEKCQVTQQITARIGCVIDLSSRVGKEQKIAMEMAVQDLFKSTCAKVDLHLKDSQGNSARATAAGKFIVAVPICNLNECRYQQFVFVLQQSISSAANRLWPLSED